MHLSEARTHLSGRNPGPTLRVDSQDGTLQKGAERLLECYLSNPPSGPDRMISTLLRVDLEPGRPTDCSHHHDVGVSSSVRKADAVQITRQ